MDLRRRATHTFSTVALALDELRVLGPSSVTVLYFSEGYHSTLAPEPSVLLEAAARVRAAIYTIDPRGLVNGPVGSSITRAEWEAYIEATQDSLRTIAGQTQGAAVFSAAQLDAVLSGLP